VRLVDDNPELTLSHRNPKEESNKRKRDFHHILQTQLTKVSAVQFRATQLQHIRSIFGIVGLYGED
jgi:hypothetical protein